MAKAKTCYKVIVGNDEYFGSVLGIFESKRHARAEANVWKRGMVNIEPPADRPAARAAYQFEIEEVGCPRK